MIRKLLKLFGGRKGGATHHGKGGSAVHREGKRQSNKAIRKELNAITKKYKHWNAHDNDLKEYMDIPEGEHCCNDPITRTDLTDECPDTYEKLCRNFYKKGDRS